VREVDDAGDAGAENDPQAPALIFVSGPDERIEPAAVNECHGGQIENDRVDLLDAHRGPGVADARLRGDVQLAGYGDDNGRCVPRNCDGQPVDRSVIWLWLCVGCRYLGLRAAIMRTMVRIGRSWVTPEYADDFPRARSRL
jgi:hypothetical protein